MFLLGALAVLAGAGALGYLIWRAIKKHREAMETLASRTGWSLHRNDTALPGWLPDVHPFNFGHPRRADWVFKGRVDDVPFVAFQYRCITQSHDKNGTQTQTHHFRCCVMDMPLDGHDLAISKEHVLRKMWDAIGGEDIDFESDAFSRRFWVKCRERRFAYDVLHPAMMDHLMPHADWTWNWVGKRLVLHKAGSLKAQTVEPMVELSRRFRSLLPRHLTAAP